MRLNEVMVASNPRLSAEQEKVLFQLFMAQGAGDGDILKGDEHALTAAEFLVQTEMIVPRNGGFEVTPTGVQVLIGQGLIDQLTHQPTQLAQKYNNETQ